MYDLLEELDTYNSDLYHTDHYTEDLIGRSKARIIKLEALVSDLRAKNDDYEKRNQRLVDAMEQWGWQHCTTEVELIEQIDDIKTKLNRYEDALKQAKKYIEAACDFNPDWFELSGSWIAISNALEKEL